MPGKRFECVQSVSQRRNARLVIDLTSLVIKDGTASNVKHTPSHSLLYKCISYLICMYRSEAEGCAGRWCDETSDDGFPPVHIPGSCCSIGCVCIGSGDSTPTAALNHTVSGMLTSLSGERCT